jgi:hypothetical protein
MVFMMAYHWVDENLPAESSAIKIYRQLTVLLGLARAKQQQAGIGLKGWLILAQPAWR